MYYHSAIGISINYLYQYLYLYMYLKEICISLSIFICICFCICKSYALYDLSCTNVNKYPMTLTKHRFIMPGFWKYKERTKHFYFVIRYCCQHKVSKIVKEIDYSQIVFFHSNLYVFGRVSGFRKYPLEKIKSHHSYPLTSELSCGYSYKGKWPLAN